MALLLQTGNRGSRCRVVNCKKSLLIGLYPPLIVHDKDAENDQHKAEKHHHNAD
jgi:hypothetical protein